MFNFFKRNNEPKPVIDFRKLNDLYGSLDLYKAYAIEYFKKLELSSCISKQDFYQKYLKSFQLTELEVSQITFNRWLKTYCKENNLRYLDGTGRTFDKVYRYHYIKRAL